MKMDSPLWQRGVRGDFIEIFDSIGVKRSILQEDSTEELTPHPVEGSLIQGLTPFTARQLDFKTLSNVIYSERERLHLKE
jgi:hypothetical protein